MLLSTHFCKWFDTERHQGVAERYFCITLEPFSSRALSIKKCHWTSIFVRKMTLSTKTIVERHFLWNVWCWTPPLNIRLYVGYVFLFACWDWFKWILCIFMSIIVFYWDDDIVMDMCGDDWWMNFKEKFFVVILLVYALAYGRSVRRYPEL